MIKSATQSTIANTQKYRNVNGSYVASSDYKLDEVVLTSTATSVTFDVSPFIGAYKNLQIRSIVRGTRAGDGDAYFLRFNGDSGANYTFHRLSGNGSGVSAGAGTGENRGYLADITSAGSPTNAFSPVITDILDFGSINKTKTTRSLSGRTTAEVAVRSALWINTSAITSINIFALNGNLDIGSRFSLYGSN